MRIGNSSAIVSDMSFSNGGRRHFRIAEWFRRMSGIVHQVNLEYIAKTCIRGGKERAQDRISRHARRHGLHTTMINGLGVVGWGVGGIEAEGAMLGQPLSMLIPQVLGFRFHGQVPEGATATDVVLTE